MPLPMKGGTKKAMLPLHINDENALYASYLPFLKRGGLFCPTEGRYQLGDEVFLQLTLMGDRIPVPGKVVWINPKGAQGNRPAGIGVHFGESDKGATREKIEKHLAALLRSEKPTYTM